MNQETINVTLLAKDEDTDILSFAFSNENIEINLNEAECQSNMKHVFSALLKRALLSNITLEFHAVPEYSRKMYVEVCEEYIKDLNRELAEVTATIRTELEY